MKKVTAELQNSQLVWYDGFVQLRESDTNLKGLVQFNEKLRILKFRTDESEEVLKPNEVTQFEYFDQELEKERKFISIDYPLNEDYKKMDGFRYVSLTDAPNGPTAFTFFELLCETKQFALICKVSKLGTIESYHYDVNFQTGSRTPRGNTTEFAQEITFYFLDTKGNVFPYNRATRIETRNSTKVAKDSFFKGITYDKSDDIELGNRFLKRIMGNQFPAVQEFISTNKLKSSDVEDLIKIVEHYKKLETN